MTSEQALDMDRWARTRRVLRLAIPSAAEAMLGRVVGLVNIYLVGHLGAASIAAVGLGWHVAFSVMILFTGVGTGATALVARMVGADDRAGANRATMQGLIVAFLVVMTVQNLTEVDNCFNLVLHIIRSNITIVVV